MNLSQLEYFVEAVSRGSFASAGRALFVSPQAISKGIGELEREIGIPLFEKSANKIEPTPFGVSFSEKAKEAIRSVADLKSMADSYAEDSGVQGDIVLAVGSSFLSGSYFRTACLRHLPDRYPQINLSVMFSESGICLMAVEQGMADAAIILGRVDSPEMHCVKLFDSPACIAMSSENKLARIGCVSVRDLDGAKLASPHDLRYTYAAFRGYLSENCVRARMCDIEANVSSYRSFMDGGGIVLISGDFLEVEELYPGCVCVPLDEENPFVVPVCFVCRKESRSSAMRCLEYHLAKDSVRES